MTLPTNPMSRCAYGGISHASYDRNDHAPNRTLFVSERAFISVPTVLGKKLPGREVNCTMASALDSPNPERSHRFWEIIARRRGPLIFATTCKSPKFRASASVISTTRKGMPIGNSQRWLCAGQL
jgi:hypothetical protein